MKENKTNTNVQGIGFTGLLTILFIALKLCGVISWSWFWVFSPIIFSTALTLVLILICFIVIKVVKR